MQITKEMTVDEVLSTFPAKSQKLASTLLGFGLHCVGCGAATWETLEAGALGHGLTPKDLEKLVIALNQVVEEEASNPNTITITKRAAEYFKKILEEEGREDCALRFGDEPGGCSGYEYTLDFSEKALPDDEIFTMHGLEVHVNKKALPRLLGCEIDYEESLRSSGFKISNPNAKGCCSCGKSQSY